MQRELDKILNNDAVDLEDLWKFLRYIDNGLTGTPMRRMFRAVKLDMYSGSRDLVTIIVYEVPCGDLFFNVGNYLEWCDRLLDYSVHNQKENANLIWMLKVDMTRSFGKTMKNFLNIVERLELNK